MKNIIRLESFAEFIAAYIFFQFLNLPEWYFWAFLLVPDISMLGYLGGNKIGAISYNIFHHKGIAILTALLGVLWSSDMMMFIGAILYAHASMDRIFGYGLKYFTDFSDTHLGKIGKRHK